MVRGASHPIVMVLIFSCVALAERSQESGQTASLDLAFNLASKDTAFCKIFGPEGSGISAVTELDYVTEDQFTHDCTIQATWGRDQVFVDAFHNASVTQNKCRCSYADDVAGDQGGKWRMMSHTCTKEACWEDYKYMYDRAANYMVRQKLNTPDGWKGEQVDCTLTPCHMFTLNDNPFAMLVKIAKLQPPPIKPVAPKADDPKKQDKEDARKAVIEHENQALKGVDGVTDGPVTPEMTDPESDLETLETVIDASRKEIIKQIVAFNEDTIEEMVEEDDVDLWPDLMVACHVEQSDFDLDAESVSRMVPKVCAAYDQCNGAVEQYLGINSEDFESLNNAVAQCPAREAAALNSHALEDYVQDLRMRFVNLANTCRVDFDDPELLKKDSYLPAICSDNGGNPNEQCEDEVAEFRVGSCTDPRCDVVSIKLAALQAGVGKCRTLRSNMVFELARVQGFCHFSNQDLEKLSALGKKKRGFTQWLKAAWSGDALTKLCEGTCKAAIKTSHMPEQVAMCDEPCQEAFQKITQFWWYMSEECP